MIKLSLENDVVTIEKNGAKIVLDNDYEISAVAGHLEDLLDYYNEDTTARVFLEVEELKED